MLTTQTLTKSRLSTKEKIEQFDLWVKVFGFKTPTRDDLVEGTELIMIEVERYMEPHNQGLSFTAWPGGTRIRLDNEPIAPSNAVPSKELVFYHCILPQWSGQCFVPIEDFITSGYRAGVYDNDRRYVIKA